MSEVEGRLPVRFSFIVERADSKYVPWNISDDESKVMDGRDDYPLHEDVSLFETETWLLPIDSKAAKVGERFKITGDVDLVFSKSWTDYGYEYDVDFEGDLSCTPVAALQAFDEKGRGKGGV